MAERKRAETATAKIGKPKIGGPFVLTTQDGGSFSDKDLLGRWSLVYVSCYSGGERREVLMGSSLDSRIARTSVLRSSTRWVSS